jgi:4-hydroxy-tetrahydrodipicolinate synthase
MGLCLNLVGTISKISPLEISNSIAVSKTPMKQSIKGSIVAIVTPMLDNGGVDLDSLKKLVEWHIQSGTAAIVVAGTTGEAPVLNADEYQQIIRQAVAQSNARIPIIAGNGTSSTWKTIELTKMATSLGADACLCVTPYYNRPEQVGLIGHYQAVAESENIAQILYNVPARTGVDLLPETVLELADVDNIVAIKEAVALPERQRELIRLVGDKIDLFSGDDESCLDFMLQGAVGVISVTSNVAPVKMAKMCDFALKNEIHKAQLLNQQLLGLHQDLFVESNPCPTKWLLSKMGKCGYQVRSPLTPLSSKYYNILANSALQAGININVNGEM